MKITTISPGWPKCCLCSEFSSQVPNPKSFIGAPASALLPCAGCTVQWGPKIVKMRPQLSEMGAMTSKNVDPKSVFLTNRWKSWTQTFFVKMSSGPNIEFYVPDHEYQTAIMAKFRAFMLNLDLLRTTFWNFCGPLLKLFRTLSHMFVDP